MPRFSQFAITFLTERLLIRCAGMKLAASRTVADLPQQTVASMGWFLAALLHSTDFQLMPHLVLLILCKRYRANTFIQYAGDELYRRRELFCRAIRWE